MPVNPSESQSNASRENGAHSHGATSEAGKQACRMNAIKHGLCGRILLIPQEDSEAYDWLTSQVFKHYKPASDMEKLAVQEILDSKWKLRNVAVYESGLLARGRLALANSFGPDVVHPEERHIIVEAEIQHTYSKSLTNLAIQQGRAERHLVSKVKEFEKLRAERELIQFSNANVAMWSVEGDPNDRRPAHPDVGSVFSLEYLGARLKFRRGAGEENIPIFDRFWGDPMAKRPAS